MPSGVYLRPSAEERFWSKVNKTDTCWLWTASKSHAGYGQFRYKSKTKRSHRFAYELTVGLIPKGLTLDHLCRVRHCVNPSHLESVTQKENVLRGNTIASKHACKTHCKQGHLYLGANLYIQPNGGRVCKLCKRLLQQAWRKKQKEQNINNGLH